MVVNNAGVMLTHPLHLRPADLERILADASSHRGVREKLEELSATAPSD